MIWNWIKTRYYVWMPYAVVLMIGVCLFFYVGYAIQKSERDLCGLLVPLDQANSHTAPSTAFGRAYAAELHRQVILRGC